MNLRSITLLAAITQLLALVFGIFSFVRFALKLRWTDNWEFYVGQPFYLLSHVMLTVFLFVLVARQKNR